MDTNSRELTETNKIKIAYNRMYSVLSDYIWDFDTVAALVDVELEAYKVFPDIRELKRKTQLLRTRLNGAVDRSNSTRILKSVDKFMQMLDSVDEVYVKVKYPREVLA